MNLLAKRFLSMPFLFGAIEKKFGKKVARIQRWAIFYLIAKKANFWPDVAVSFLWYNKKKITICKII
jgi:hypothetical protein